VSFGVIFPLFSIIQAHVVQFLYDYSSSCEKVSLEHNLALIASFTEAEIHAVVFIMAPDNRAGPDGFSIHFYQHFWPLIKSDLLLPF
jgi:hypothetical protein